MVTAIPQYYPFFYPINPVVYQPIIVAPSFGYYFSIGKRSPEYIEQGPYRFILTILHLISLLKSSLRYLYKNYAAIING